MEPGTASQGRVTKRSPNACTRCRRQKIKCSGLQPCDSCSKRKLVCVFDGRDNKVLVTQGYLSDLQQKIAHLEEQQSRLYASSELSHEDHDGDAQVATPDASQHDSSTVVATQSDTHGDDPPMMKAQVLSPEAADLTNPLTVMPSTYMSASNGRTFYLGTSSNWSFSRKVLSLTHEHVYNEPLPTAALLFDGFAYDIGWDGSRSSPSPPDPVLPSPDHAIYLINAVKFHCGQLFHLFDEDDFMAGLHRFYSNSLDRPDSAGLWYIHFLTVLALGKSFTLQKNQGRKPSGANFIAKALHLLPDITFLCREPVEATEILCCIALYLQSLDFRNSADVFIGQAMRTAMGYGMNTDMPIRILGEHLVQRCRKIWWTVYILDRQMTSLMGNPSSISDDDVYCQLPTFAGSVQRTAALGMQVKLARVIAHINGTVYGSSGRLRKKFLTSTKAVLEGIARLADELRQTFPLHSEESFGGVSRMSAHLHILYHQCIVLATRPMLFCCLNMQYEAPSSMLQSFLAPPSKIRNLLTMCMESSIQILHILDGLQNQGLLEAFMPFDLDSLFMTTIVLLVGRVVDAQLLGSDPPAWLERAYALFDEMITRGNLVAEFRKTEVEKLASMMRLIGGGGGSRPTFPGSSDAAGIQAPQPTVGSMLAQQHQTHQQEQLAANNTVLAPPPPTMPMTTMAATGISASLPSFYQDVTAPFHLDIGGADGGDGGDFTAEQIMAVANSIGGEDVEWISRAIIENSIWETE